MTRAAWRAQCTQEVRDRMKAIQHEEDPAVVGEVLRQEADRDRLRRLFMGEGVSLRDVLTGG